MKNLKMYYCTFSSFCLFNYVTFIANYGRFIMYKKALKSFIKIYSITKTIGISYMYSTWYFKATCLIRKNIFKNNS